MAGIYMEKRIVSKVGEVTDIARIDKSIALEQMREHSSEDSSVSKLLFQYCTLIYLHSVVQH